MTQRIRCCLRRPNKSVVSHERRLRFETLEGRNLPAILVTTLGDVVNTNDGVTSLREAINSANATAGADTINFSPALFLGGPAAIVLTQGELTVSDALTINGPGSAILTIDASGNDPTPQINNGDGSRILNIIINSSADLPVTLQGLSLTGGDVSGNGGGISAGETLTVRDCNIFDNSAKYTSTGTGLGGGIYAQNLLTIERTVVRRNASLGDLTSSGGGIYGSTTSTISESVLLENSTGFRGGGFCGGYATLSNCVISNNVAYWGGGAYLDGGSFSQVLVENTTVVGNYATYIGGGLGLGVSSGNIRVVNSTISNNRAGGGGGGITAISDPGRSIWILHCTITNNEALGTVGGGGLRAGGVEVRNSIIATNIDQSGSAPDILKRGNLFYTYYCVVGNNAGAGLSEAPVGSPDAQGNLVGGPTNGLIDPRLGPLVYNGGPIFVDGSAALTRALLPSSPTIDMGDPTAVAGVGDVRLYDQRGVPFARIVNGDNVPGARIDIGAFERQSNPLTGDYGFNGSVDAADYVLWRRTKGSTTDLRADGDADGDVDANDYSTWRSNFGRTRAGSSVGSSLSTVESVSESPLPMMIPQVSSPDHFKNDVRRAEQTDIVFSVSANWRRDTIYRLGYEQVMPLGNYETNWVSTRGSRNAAHDERFASISAPPQNAQLSSDADLAGGIIDAAFSSLGWKFGAAWTVF